jgi:hypothetical protein
MIEPDRLAFKCARCKDSIPISDEGECLMVDGTGGFLCELCVDLKEDLAKIIVKYVTKRIERALKEKE